MTIEDTIHTASILAMRVARPTRDLKAARRFYEQLVGLAVLSEFADHDGYDGVIFGVPNGAAQLEIVNAPHALEPQPTIEDALVLYLTARAKHTTSQRLRTARTPEITPDSPNLNPFWPRSEATAFMDPDGYALILANG